VTSADSASISTVVLIRPGSVTHTFDTDQRLVELTFRQSGGALAVDAPANGNIAPPGYYMLFLVNDRGVPSVASFVRLPSPSEDSQAPTAPGVLTATGGMGIATLGWNAATDNKAVVAYHVHRANAAGFTPTLANRIAQTTVTTHVDAGIQAGSYFYVVTAQDAAGNVSVPSNEAAAAVTADISPPVVAITSPAPDVTVSGTVSVAASAGDDVAVAGVQFLVDDVNLGVEDTAAPFSVSWNSVGSTNGLHALSASARDSGGNRTRSESVTVLVSNTAPPPVGLVAAYNFDQGSGVTAADLSGNGNTGTITGAQWTTGGHSGGALSFNGIDNWVTVNDTASLGLTVGMTLEAWIFPTAAANWRSAILKERPDGLAYALYSSNDGGLPDGYVRVGGDMAATGGAPLPLNSWTHVALTYDGATLRLFANGVQAAARSVGGPIEGSRGAPLRFGGNAVWGEFFAGRLDDVRIYNRSLTAAEIQRDMVTPVQ
jgi:hypothetical protein